MGEGCVWERVKVFREFKKLDGWEMKFVEVDGVFGVDVEGREKWVRRVKKVIVRREGKWRDRFVICDVVDDVGEVDFIDLVVGKRKDFDGELGRMYG